MKLDQELFERIVDLLNPHMDEDNRHSLVTPIFSVHESLYSQIQWSGNNKAFVTRLVSLLARYGKVESGEESLILLLNTLRSQIGLDGRNEIDEALIQIGKLHTPHSKPLYYVDEKSMFSDDSSNNLPQWAFYLIMTCLTLLIILFITYRTFPELSTPTQPNRNSKEPAIEVNVSDHIATSGDVEFTDNITTTSVPFSTTTATKTIPTLASTSEIVTIQSEQIDDTTNVHISNLTSKSATITWISEQATLVEIHYGTDPRKLTEVAKDIRDEYQSTPGYIHYVVLRNLQPETKYYFKIIKIMGRTDSIHILYEFTSRPTILPPMGKALYGKIVNIQGDPVLNAIVLLHIIDIDGAGSEGRSSTLSGLTNEDGYWIPPDSQSPLNLNSFVAREGVTYFEYTSEDQIGIEVINSIDCNVKNYFDINERSGEMPEITLPC